MGVPISTLNVKFKMTEFHTVKTAERGLGDPGSSRTDEPYLMVVYYKLDGDSLRFNSKTGKLESPWPEPPQEPGPSPDMVPDINGHVGKPPKRGDRPEDHEPPKPPPSWGHVPYASVWLPVTSGRHKNIGVDLDKNDDKLDGLATDGARAPIFRGIGEFNTALRPIPVVPPVGDLKFALGAIGCFVVLMEEDNTLDSAVAKGASTLRDRVSAQLATALAEVKLGPEVLESISPEEATNAALKRIDDNMSGIDRVLARFDLDDYVGNHIFRYSHTALVLRKNIPFFKRRETPHQGTWEIRGEVTASERK